MVYKPHFLKIREPVVQRLVKLLDELDEKERTDAQPQPPEQQTGPRLFDELERATARETAMSSKVFDAVVELLTRELDAVALEGLTTERHCLVCGTVLEDDENACPDHPGGQIGYTVSWRE